MPAKLPDLDRALEALPLFPLPQAVLFPGAMLPLHIFEPRYRAMIRAALEGGRVLAVVLVPSPDEVDAHGHPALAHVAGLGEIVDHAELAGGRYNILLRGRARVRLRELPFEAPFRRARAEILEPPAFDVAPADVTALVSAATAFASVVKKRDKSFEFRFPKDGTPSLLADLCAHHLVLDAQERQAVLETLDPLARVRRVIRALAVQRLALQPTTGVAN